MDLTSGPLNIAEVLQQAVLMLRNAWYSLFASASLGSALAQSALNPGLASVNGVYNGSVTPSSLPWNTYNYCNAPHVIAAEYTVPNVSDAKLVYLNTVMRHHKVSTPDILRIHADLCAC